METLKLKENFYWTGILDKELKVFDIVMETEFGTTYNSYVLIGSEKTVLFETAKLKFFDTYLEKLQKIVNIDDIDYVVVNHTEPDHAGSLEKLIEMNPNIKVVGTACALNFLKDILNRDFYKIPVKENDTLSIGDKTLRFMVLPNLHWPDTMYTFIEEDKTLVTCDSFGSHYSFDDVLLSKVTDEEGYMRATKYYFDNIIGPYKAYMVKALERIKNIDVQMICTGHGPVIDTRIDEIKAIYAKWSQAAPANTKKRVVIPYVSAYGYTGLLAEEIAKGIKECGDVDVLLFDMVVANQSEVLEEIAIADGILFGTPTIIGEALKPIWDLTTSIFASTHGGKLASAFGSYAWSGEGVPHILERLKQLRMNVVEGYRIKLKPSENDLTGAFEFGYGFGCRLLDKQVSKGAKGKKKMVKCLICGEIFEEGTEICPVCGVGKENFIEVEVSENTHQNNTNEIVIVIGNGAAGLSAATALRERNATCSIVMISDENVMSYNRPMLTKSMLAGFDPSQIAIYDQAWYEENKILNLLQQKVNKIDPKHKEVSLCDGNKLKYDRLVIATGAECFMPPIEGIEHEGVIAIRRISDTIKVKESLSEVRNVVVIGGGVLGLEAAWELGKTKCKVTVLELAPQIMGRQLDMSGSEMLETIIRQSGIDVMTNVKIKKFDGYEKVKSVVLQDGTVLDADLVIISCGISPNVELAKEAGIAVERAIVVNEHMETSVKDIYAVGDCAQFQNVNLGNWAQAVEMGKVAGARISNDEAHYQTVSCGLSFNGMNTSLFAMGDNGKNEKKVYKTMEVKDPVKLQYEKYYFVNNRLCGIILIGDTSKLAKLSEAVEKQLPFKEVF